MQPPARNIDLIVEQRQFHKEATAALMRSKAVFTFTSIGIENTTAFRCITRTLEGGEGDTICWANDAVDALPRHARRALVTAHRGLPLPRGSVHSSDGCCGGVHGPHIAVPLCFNGVCYGVVAWGRRVGDPPFSVDDVCMAQGASGVITLAARLLATQTAAMYESLARSAFGDGEGLLMLVNRSAQRVIWATRRGKSISWRKDVLERTPALLRDIELQLAPQQGRVSKPHLGPGRAAISVMPVDAAGLGIASCAAVRLGPPITVSGLSSRESQVAVMLINGYANVSIAITMGLSENTVRTYVRRLYRKLKVCSRVGLTQALLSMNSDAVRVKVDRNASALGEARDPALPVGVGVRVGT